MKTKALSIILFIFSLIFLSFSDPYSIKRISDKEFRYEFYTTNKKIKTNKDKIYFWFKGGNIHNSQSGFGGELLEDKFTKMYLNNQLAEQGFFKKGLKNGLWKTWYKNGTIETTQNWSRGLKSGDFYHFAENGAILEKGKYKNDKKHGFWIDFIKKDTINYKNGNIFVKKIKLSKEEKEKNKALKNASNKNKQKFFKRLFSKKESK